MRPDTQIRSGLDRVELPLGPIYSFVPARGGSRAGAVAEQLSRTLTEVSGLSVLLAGFAAREYSLWNPSDSPRRLDGHTWGAFVFDSHGIEVLDAFADGLVVEVLSGVDEDVAVVVGKQN